MADGRMLMADGAAVTELSPTARIVRWAYLGRVEYARAVRLQRALLDARAEGATDDALLLVEHPPVITLGRRGSRADVLVGPAELAARGIAVHDTNRGGLVTYHGPGQIVGYPIVGLRALTGGDVVRYVYGLEETVIGVLADLGIAAGRDPQHHGVWVGPTGSSAARKIAAVGVAVSRGVTMHGFALNVQPELAHFELIRPCGIADRGVTSVAALLGHRVDLTTIAAALAASFGRAFARELVAVPPAAFWRRAEI